jgi:hypothetical protein
MGGREKGGERERLTGAGGRRIVIPASLKGISGVYFSKRIFRSFSFEYPSFFRRATKRSSRCPSNERAHTKATSDRFVNHRKTIAHPHARTLPILSYGTRDICRN